MKRFHVQYSIGKARHVVSYHDGAKTHPDGSPFFDLAICRNKKRLAKFVATLKASGYVEA